MKNKIRTLVSVLLLACLVLTCSGVFGNTVDAASKGKTYSKVVYQRPSLKYWKELTYSPIALKYTIKVNAKGKVISKSVKCLNPTYGKNKPTIKVDSKKKEYYIGGSVTIDGSSRECGSQLDAGLRNVKLHLSGKYK